MGCIASSECFVHYVFRASVTITDLADFVPLMNLNITENAEVLKAEITAKELKWGEDVTSFKPPVDFLLLADCIYYEEVKIQQ